MKNIRRLLAIFSLALLLVVTVEPYPGSPLDVDSLTDESSLIAVGQVTSVRELGKTSVTVGDRELTAQAMAAELHVDRVLKGTIEGSSSLLEFDFAIPDQFVGWDSVAPLSYRVFFLKATASKLALASPYYPSFPAVPETSMRGNTPIESVIAELGSVLASPKSSVQQKQEVVYALDSSRHEEALAELRLFSEKNDSILRLSISAALLHHNDISTLKYAVSILLKPDPNIPPDALHNLSAAILLGVKNPRAVEQLANLLRSGSAESRRAAAGALMRIGTTSCINPLLVGTSDSDVQVRYFSAVGLAEITGQADWRPNMDDFTSDEKKYLNHWREWAKSQ